MLIQHLKLGPPQNEENILDLLQPYLPSIPVIKSMKWFRNILVHKYGDIDQKKVYSNALTGSGDFYQFLEEVRKILENLPNRAESH